MLQLLPIIAAGCPAFFTQSTVWPMVATALPARHPVERCGLATAPLPSSADRCPRAAADLRAFQ
jgi:hypothetical protein